MYTPPLENGDHEICMEALSVENTKSPPPNPEIPAWTLVKYKFFISWKILLGGGEDIAQKNSGTIYP